LLTTTLNENKIKNWGFCPLIIFWEIKMENEESPGLKKKKMPLNRTNRGANPWRGESKIEKS